MSPSEATNQATREERRDLGFYYVASRDEAVWRIVGSFARLSKFVKLLDAYVRHPRNAQLSENEHYGPYMHLKLQTASSPAIDFNGIRGSISDITRLRDVVSAGLSKLEVGQSLVVSDDFAPNLDYELREVGFDPASADPQACESAV